MRLLALLWGAFGVATFIGLYWPNAFVWANLQGFFTEPPKWLKSTALVGMLVAVTFDMNPLIALGLVVLWGRRFPAHFRWLGDWNFFGSIPAWWEELSELIKSETGLSMGTVAWPMLIDTIGFVLSLVGLTIWLHSFAVGGFIIAAAIAIVLWMKISGNSERATHLFDQL